jgi:predicted deacylase
MLTDPPVNLLPVDIRGFRHGNTGIDYVHRFDSGKVGPSVMINAATHGNEVCGAHALKYLFEHDIRPCRGSLYLSFANVAAYESFDERQPTASRYVEEDFNRLWSDDILDGSRTSVEVRRAQQLRPAIRQVDYLLDIHSMHLPSPPLMLCGTAEKGRELAKLVGVPMDIVADAGHRAGPRLRDYNDFADLKSPKAALLIECGQHWDPASSDLAIEASFRFLAGLGIIDDDCAMSHLPSKAPPAQRIIEVTEAVTVLTDDFAFQHLYQGMEVIAKKGSLLASDGEREIRTPYDDCVLIMPSRRLVVGQTAVRLGRIVD